MIEGKLPATVDASCGTINHDDGQAGAVMNVDGGRCGRSASRFVKDDDMTIEVLVCGHHLEKARQRVKEVMG